MKSIKNYNIYIFITTILRNIIDVYSVIFLYKSQFTVHNIIKIYLLVYLLGVFISNLVIRLGNKIGYKYILIFSTIISSITYFYISNYNNLYIISLLLSLSIFTYHPVRHYFGISLLKNKKDIANTLIFTYIAIILSGIFIIKKVSIYYLIIISLLGIIPSLFIKKTDNEIINLKTNINRYKFLFFVFDQFKILFLLFEPLYIYIISSNIKFVGLFNIILTVSSIVCVYLTVRRNNIINKFMYINIFFSIILLIKVSINDNVFLLIIAFIEGILIKLNELISTVNLYNYNNINAGYIIKVESIFCFTRVIILLVFYITNINFHIALYILILGIFIQSFIYKKINLFDE